MGLMALGESAQSISCVTSPSLCHRRSSTPNNACADQSDESDGICSEGINDAVCASAPVTLVAEAPAPGGEIADAVTGVVPARQGAKDLPGYTDDGLRNSWPVPT